MADVEILELPLAPIWSLRQSRAVANAESLAAAFKSIGRHAPVKPNTLTGDAESGCGWLEPHAWLVNGSTLATTMPAGLLLTEISDRLAAFQVGGDGAIDLIAAGCDPQMVSIGTMARTRFGGVANVVIQYWSDNDYRLLVDVSIASAFRVWLADASRSVGAA